MATIDQLIQTHKGNRTWPQLVAKLDEAEAAGVIKKALSKAILQRIGRTGYRPERVDFDTVEALAYAFDVSREQVFLAYGESKGIDARRWESDFVAVAPTGLRDLPPEDLTYLVSVARGLVEQARRRAELASTPPTPRAAPGKAPATPRAAKKAAPSPRRRPST